MTHLSINRPETTLFMLVSVDGKISTGDTDVLDFDKDLPNIPGVKEGLYQYYDLEQETDLFSLNSGKVQKKVGANERLGDVEKLPVSFIIIDNRPHLELSGVDHFIKKSQTFFLVTTNKNHPAFERQGTENLKILYYENEIDFSVLFARLKDDFAIESLTIQTGGTLNAVLLRGGLIDHISIVLAPVLVGGKDTPTLVDGVSFHSHTELSKIKALKLKKCDVLNDSYLHLRYDVLN